MVVATKIGACEGGCDDAVIPADKRSLQVVTDRVSVLVHREKLLVLDDRTHGVNRAAEPGELASDENALAMVGLVRRVERVHGETGDDLAGNNAVQRVGTADAAEIDIGEQNLG